MNRIDAITSLRYHPNEIQVDFVGLSGVLLDDEWHPVEFTVLLRRTDPSVNDGRQVIATFFKKGSFIPSGFVPLTWLQVLGFIRRNYKRGRESELLKVG